MSQSKRRHFTAEQKGEILRRHLGNKVPVSDLCDEYGIQPSLFYTWQRQLPTKATATRDQEKIEALEAKLARKDSVIAEISEEYVDLKKTLGEN
jgi:transposase